MLNYINSIQEGIQQLKEASNVQSFQSSVASLRDYMKKLGMGSQVLIDLENCKK